MPVIQIGQDLAIVRLQLRPHELPALLKKHAEHYPGAIELEGAGKALIGGGFEPEQSLVFVEKVCSWGRGHRLQGRVRDNGGPTIASAFKRSVELADRGNVVEAVTEIQTLRNLGQSFASKHLRFMRPSCAVILDSVIRTHLGYPANSTGYGEFLADCKTILKQVRQLLPDGQDFRICDVEAAIFAKIQGY